MAKLSYSQLVELAVDAGFPRSQAPVAAAVAMAESGGNPSAINSANKNGSVDYGLWQINSIHGQLLKQGTWSNPADNAEMAYQVYKNAGNSFRPWVAYNSGSYKKFEKTTHDPNKLYSTDMNGVTTEAGSVTNARRPTVGEGLDYLVPDGVQRFIPFYGAVKGAKDTVDKVGFFLDLLSDGAFWRRLGIGLGGFALLFAGFLFVVNSTKMGQQARGMAVAAASRGAVPPPTPKA